MADSKTSYESFYEGGVSSLSPDYGNFTGYRMNASQLGFPGSAQTANQIGEVVNAMKQGAKAFEVTMVVPDTAETIPKQHFKEMRALMKLSGVKPSVHGPLIDAAGFGEKGWGGDIGRADNERRMFDTIEKAHELDPKGNIPIVFHSGNGTPGSDWRPGDKSLGEEKVVMEKGIAINQETGQPIELKREHKFRPGLDPTRSYAIDEKTGRTKEIKGGKHGLLFDAESSLDSANLGEWDSKLTEVAQMNKHAGELIGLAPQNLIGYDNAFINREGEIFELDKYGEKKKALPSFDEKEKMGQRGAYEQLKRADIFLENADLSFKSAFHQAYKYGSKEQKKALELLSEGYRKKIGATHDTRSKDGEFFNILGPAKKQELINESLETLREITKGRSPDIYKMSEDFAIDKASQTFGNLAMKSYEKFGGSAPVIAIENMFGGMALSRANELRELVKKSRNNFAEKLIEEEGLSKKEAKEIAEKQIGVTWDVGHLNIMKKKGFTDKDIIEQTKLITKDKSMVKHVHLTDNFGYADTHLAPGMGNVPIKKILEQLEKTGQFDKMRKIVEAPSFVQHFKKSPHGMTLAAFGSPLYSMKAAPYWNQVENMQGNYFGGYGTVNPSIHHQYFGAGFTTMPVELGGQAPGGQSRFGGTPMS